MATKQRSSKWIQEAMGKPGALHEELGIPKGQKLSDADLKRAEAAGGKEAARARLARKLEGFRHNRGKSAEEVTKAVKKGRRAKKKAAPEPESESPATPGGSNPPFGSKAWRAKYGK